MKPLPKPHLALFAAAAIFTLALVSWAEFSAWSQLAALRERFDQVQSDAFHIADQLKAKLLRLNDLVVAYEVSENPNVLLEFQQSIREVERLITHSKPRLNSSRERTIIAEIERAFAAYVAAAQGLIERSKSARGDLSREVFQGAEAASMELLLLCETLGSAHRASLQGFVRSSGHSIEVLRFHVAVSLFLLLVLGASTAILVYKGMLSPLLLRLSESQATIRRQEKLSSLGVLAAGVAHEIRNPLTAVKIRLHSLQRVLANAPSAAEDVQVIRAEINRLENIVRDFLQFARPGDPVVQAFPVGALFQEIDELLAPELGKKNIRLESEAAPHFVLHADRNQVKQVLINLVQNAADSMDRDGVVTLCAEERTEAVAGALKKAAVLSVADTGQGIPVEAQERLFDPFFTTKESGTGLGLSIAARIVEKHGGALRYETEQNKGTTFFIVLPE